MVDVDRLRRTPGRAVRPTPSPGAIPQNPPAFAPGNPAQQYQPTPQQQPPATAYIPPGYAMDGQGRLIQIPQQQYYPQAPQAPAALMQDLDFDYEGDEEVPKKKQKKSGLFGRRTGNEKPVKESNGKGGNAVALFIILLLTVAGIGFCAYMAVTIKNSQVEAVKTMRYLLVAMAGQFLLMGAGFTAVWAASRK